MRTHHHHFFTFSLKILIASLFLSHGAYASPTGTSLSGSGTTEFFYFNENRLDTSKWYIANGWSGGHISCEWRSSALTMNKANNSLTITLSDKGGKVRPIGCGVIQSIKRFGYGTYEARMRTAAGSGLNTAFFTYIGPGLGVPHHDEIDFEFLGKNPTTVEINYWTSGKSMGGKIIKLGFDASKGFHNYAFKWEPDKISWYVDGKLKYVTPAGKKLPSNPGKIYASLWSGAKNMNSWLGPFTYTKPVTAEVQWIRYTSLPNKK